MDTARECLRSPDDDHAYTRAVDRAHTAVLVERVLRRDGASADAWAELVRAYSNLVWKVLRGFDLNDADRWDAFQATWLRTLEKLDTLRDPMRFPGWLAQVATNEVHGGVLRPRAKVRPQDIDDDALVATDEDVDRDLLRQEIVDAVRLGFAQLEPECRRLLRLLVSEPPLSYREIVDIIGRPIGAIGPTRRRCLDKLRETPAVRALFRGSEIAREP